MNSRALLTTGPWGRFSSSFKHTGGAELRQVGRANLNRYKSEPDAPVHYLQDKPTHTRHLRSCGPLVESTGRKGSATPWHMPKTRWEQWSGPEPSHS
jgi:hypothetical protein